MNILYLAHRIPYPPNKGDKLRAFRHIEHLARRHRVWCACFIDDPRDLRHVRDLRRYCADVGVVEIRPVWAKLSGLISHALGRTITEGFYSSSQMRALLQDWQVSTQFDAVFAFSSGMSGHALTVSSPHRVLDLCDLDSLKWSDYADHIGACPELRLRDRILVRLFRAEGHRLAAAELRWIDRFNAAILATDAEAATLRTLVAPEKLHVIGNGVTLPHRNSMGGSTPGQASYKERRISLNPVIGFVGVMDYFPNIDAVRWFAKECWPAIRDQYPRATFRIVGRSPVRAVRRLIAIPGIEVVGEVPDISTELERFDVSIAPLRIARGVQNKVLEAMAAAKPVVLTSYAAKGIAAVPEQDYVVSDSAGPFADAVCKLLSDRSLRFAIGESGRRFVAEQRRWEGELEKLEILVAGPQQRIGLHGRHPIHSNAEGHHPTPTRSLTILH